MALMIVPEICTACGDCEPVCPTNSIAPKKGVYAINPDTCNECEGEFDFPQCIEVCQEIDCIVPLEA